MLVRFTKHDPAVGADLVSCLRPDGSVTTAVMERRGSLPHEVLHFLIESELSWHDALFGEVTRGAPLQEVTAKLHGHRSEWSKITQGLQTEALIECFEATPADAPVDPAQFAETLILACRRRGVMPPDIMPEELDRVRVAIRDFTAAWRPLGQGQSLERNF